MTAIWDREPLWRQIRRILDNEGTCTAGEISLRLQERGLPPAMGEYNLTGRVYQLLRERIATGEVVSRPIPGSKAKGYSLAAGMPKVVIHFEGSEYADLHRIAKKIRRSPEETARRILTAGIENMKEVIL